jgi:hypothetical protein
MKQKKLFGNASFYHNAIRGGNGRNSSEQAIRLLLLLA